jgi:hypothetical protein
LKRNGDSNSGNAMDFLMMMMMIFDQLRHQGLNAAQRQTDVQNITLVPETAVCFLD